MKTFLQFIFISCLVISFSFSKSIKVTTQEIVSGLTEPWGMAFLAKDTALITQKNGQIYLLNIDTKKLTQVQNPLKVFYYRQGGLLDVQVSPTFKQDGWIYFTYAKKMANKGATTLIRAKLNGNKLDSLEELLVTKPFSGSGVHFGSRITFDENGHLYFSIGDRGSRPNGQDINTHAGTIVRLNLDGSIPRDNPFVGKQGLDEIYSYGHRNPQGIFYDKKSKKLFAIEHGPRGGDEINLIEKGKNYGWATISYGREYWSNKAVGESTHKDGMEQPIKVYTPSIAPSSLLVYSGKIFKHWRGNLLSGALVLTHLNRIVLDINNKVIYEERVFEDLEERIRNVIESPDGFIYLTTDSGKILKVVTY